MATWQQLSQDNLQVATKLSAEGHIRSSISRAYYAAYCAVAGELVKTGVTFAHGWHNPAHDQLPDLVLNNTRLPRSQRFEINKALRRLRRAREDADYRPQVVLTRQDAVSYLRDLQLVLRNLEGQNE